MEDSGSNNQYSYIYVCGLDIVCINVIESKLKLGL